MILFPAVDIKGGQAVRLRRGRADDSTVFSDDPVAAALQWQEQGAKFLHLVDLDGAFEGVSPNTDLVRRICEALSIPVQLGGGIRDEETAHRWLDAGVARLIIGTLALEDPARFAALCHACPGRIGVSLDAENGRLKTRGWVGDTPYTVDDVVPRLAEDGAAFLVYTDIERDGMQTGVNVPALTHLARTSKVPVIAAGGVATLDDVKALYPLSVSANLEGAISGRAIYEGTLDLREAMSWCIPNQGGNIDQAVALLNWWINSPEANEIIMAEPGVPASSEAAKAIEPNLSDIQKKIFTYINDVITPNCSPANPPAGAGSSEVTSLITDLEEKVYYGEITAEAAAQELFEEGNRIMSEAAAQ